MALSSTAARRIQNELKEWSSGNGSEGCCLESSDSLTTWIILMQGPETAGRLYDEEVFRLRVQFPDRYPLEPPEVVFLPDSPIHPHIYTNGHICLDVLYDGANGGWSPALTINKVCLSVRSMLASNTDKTRPEGDADYCARVGNRSPKLTPWEFHDATV
eukprot:gene7592-747_t